MAWAKVSENEIVNSLVDAIVSLPTIIGSNRSNTVWTSVIKKVVAEQGVSLKHSVCTSGFGGEYDPEWLYDLVWYREDAEKHLSGVYLVLECEWQTDYNAMKYDFEKLLLAKAPVKIMVFQHWNAKKAEIFGRLKESIVRFASAMPDETYVLMGFNNDAFCFDYEIHDSCHSCS